MDRELETATPTAGNHRRITVKSLLVACLGASLGSYLLGRLVAQAWKNEFSLDDSGEASQSLGFVWAFSDTQGTPNVSKHAHNEHEEEDDEDDKDNDDDEDEDDQVEPNRKQFLLNLQNVPPELLDSEKALRTLMERIEDEADLDIVAHGCQVLANGITTRCLGLLDDGYISLYAWPEQSVLLLDLTANHLSINDMEILSNVFDIEASEATPLSPYAKDYHFGVESNWAIKGRGERGSISDYAHFMEIHDAKQEVASIQSIFQKIDVVDFFDDKNLRALEDGLKKDKEYVLNNPHLFTPDRVLFLDGVMQSLRDGNAAYHESLVQPAMFAHDNPKRVAIIGGGECATLREALKHNTIEKVIMIEIDEVMVEASKQHLPDWNDCSNFEGSSRYCMDDPRAEIFNEDAFKWFIDRFGSNSTEEEPPFDVIILDALDPQNVVEFAAALYGDSSFMSSLYNGLSENGVLVSQVGECLGLDSPAQTHSENKNRALFVDSLANQGFVNIVEYEEAGAQFEDPWTFNVAFKSLKSRYNWDDNAATVDLKIQKRAIRTLDGQSPFEYFDGLNMQGRLASKASEVVFCRQQPVPAGCERGHGFDPFRQNIGRDMITHNSTDDIIKPYLQSGASFLMLEDAVHQLSFHARTKDLIERASRHDILQQTTLANLGAFQKSRAYKPFAVDGTYKAFTGNTAFLTLANSTGTLELPGTGRSYIYNPAYARNPSAYFQMDWNVDHKNFATGYLLHDAVGDRSWESSTRILS